MLPKRVSDRLVRIVPKFQQVLKLAKDRDVNEADTVSIIKDMLADIFGYDKYLDITSEFQIRGTFCDLAVKIDNKVEFLIEAKAIGMELKDNHLKQAIDYGANKGIQWIILTNGMTWRIYKIRFEQPINWDVVCEFDFSEIDIKSEDDQDKLFLVCKEGLLKNARDEFHEKTLVVNRFILGALILSDEVVGYIRRELRKISDGIMVTPEEISKVLAGEVIKRDVLDGDDAVKAQAKIKKFYSKLARKPRDPGVSKNGSSIDADEPVGMSVDSIETPKPLDDDPKS